MFRNFKRNTLAIAAGAFAVSSAQAFVVNDTFNGLYFEGPEKNGRGFILEVVEGSQNPQEFGNSILAQWFTFRDGDPIWLIAQGDIDQNSNVATFGVFESSGGSFGDDFQASDASLTEWGTGTLTFNSCNEIILEASGTDGDVTQVLQPVTQGDCVVQEEFQSCPSFSTPGAIPGACIIQGDITSDVTLTNDITWLPQGQVNVRAPATMTIEPNTEIVGGTSGGVDFIVVRQGAKMIADGTRNNPIVMRGVDSLVRGEWGGLVVNGFAPINGCTDTSVACTALGEGDSGTYGGDDPHDNSGIYRYLVVSNAGFEFSPGNELNGIAYQGVGDGTIVEYVQVHLNADDGIEPFGGTVNMKYLVLTGNADDSFDWVLGYKGNVQYVMIKQYDDAADRGIEADNLNANNDSLPRSRPRLANFTIIGSEASDDGVLLRRGTAAEIANFIITNAGNACFDLDQDATFTQADIGDLTVRNTVIGGCAGGTFADDAADPFAISSWFLAQDGNVEADAMLNNTIPAAGSPALGIGSVPFNDPFFDNVDFAGAVRDANSDWTKGWTVGLDRNAPIGQ